MVRLFWVFAILLVCNGALAQRPESASAREVISLDKVRAIVNKEVITQLELDMQMQLATRQLVRSGTPLPDREALERQLLERLITRRVLQQYAKETGVRIDDTQLDRAVERMARDNKMSTEAFRSGMKDEGIDFSRFREDLRNEIAVQRLREREVDSRLVISDAEIDNYLKSQKANTANDEYNLLHILVTVPEAATPEQIAPRKTRAEEALAKLKQGADFKQISSTYSDAPNALEGGALGWRPSGRLPTIFAQAAATMKPGELSQLLRSPNGFHILKLVEKRNTAIQQTIQQTKARHILIRMNEIVSEAEAKRRLEEIRERISKGADFAELARSNSEDATAARGGDLGWLSAGDTVPEFEKPMDQLKPGELSEPIQTPFGWHLIQVLERRTSDITADRQRQMARNALRARKSDEAFAEWVRLQRDQAFVEYRGTEQ